MSISRRNLMTGTVTSGLGTILLGRNASHAQELSGNLTVGYDGSNRGIEPFIEAAADTLRSNHPDLKIELQPSPGGNYTTQIVLQLNGGRAPDIFLQLGVATAELAGAGFLANLDNYVANWEGWAQYTDKLREACTYDGSVWTIPYLVDTHFLYYRKDIFQKAGLPQDWQPADSDEIIAFANVIKATDSEVIPYALYAGANGGNGTVSRGFIPLVYAAGGDLQDENGLWIIDSCAIRYALDYYEKAYQTDQVVPQDVMSGSSPSTAMRAAMGNGELGILYEGCWAYRPWIEEEPEETKAEIGLAQFPINASDSTFAIGGTGNSWYMNAKASNPDAAWAFIEEFNTQANQVIMNVADPHIPARIDAAEDPAFQATEFLREMVATSDSLLLAAPDPSFRALIGIIQNATGLVASGEATPDEAALRYAEELTRVLGEDNVVSQPCT
jgi:multiple sugar transport system substrate-binding protein